MPAQLAVEKAFAGISREPRGEIIAGRFRLAALVANMGEAMRAMRVVGVGRNRSFDLWPGRRELPILGESHRVIGKEPEVVAVMRRQAIHQHRDLAFLANTPRAADQTVWVCRDRDDQ